MFVELAARTHFSFLRGGSSPRALVERAARLGYDAIGVADCDGIYGIVRALEAADELGVRLVVGCELAIDDSPIASLWLHVASLQVHFEPGTDVAYVAALVEALRSRC